MTPRGTISRRLFLGHTLASVLALPARAELPSPPDGSRVLEAREGNLSLLPEPASPTAVWSYNGGVPGPLLRFKKGEEVKVRLVNKLAQPASLNWHGVRIVNAMDGVAGLTQEPVPPGGSFDYRFTPPDSGLYWYHPHALPFISEQLDRGLYGVLIVDEPESPAADRDMLVVLADWKLDDKGQLAGFNAATDATGAGSMRPLVTLNSRAVPVEETLPPSSRLRLRVLSAVDTRLMLIAFNGVRPLILAVDSQPCEAFEPVRQMIPLGPGARFDVMLDLPGDAGAAANVTLLGDNEPDRVLLAFKTAGEQRPPLPPVASLLPNPLLPSEIKLQASRKVDILIEAITGMGTGPIPATAQDRPLYWKLNGKAFSGFAPAPLFSVKRGTPVTLGFVNDTAFVQQMHVHGHVMRLLHDLDDGWEPYWRDAVLVPEGKTKHVAFVADNPGKWVIECLMAGRQASGIATWFEAT
jgi:FtsP/CotA-like multicopper oxidase with cupredoxin domain